MYQLIKEILQNPEDKTNIKLVYCSKNDILLKKELDVLQSKHPERLKVTYLVDDGTPKVGPGDLKVHLPRRELKTAVLVCGNEG
jgi:cytochrome-b5 reductase